MKSRFYTLIILSLVWFFFGTWKIINGSTDLNELTKFEGKLINIGTTVTTDLKGRKSDIMYFNLQGLNQTLGLYHNTKKDYDFYINRLKKGDLIKVYFNAGGGKAENINLHVFQLEHEGEILLDHERVTRTDREVGLILYLVGLIFSIAPIWFYRTKMKK
ncbi:MAG: hypothetical protein ACJAS3_003100 [Roseivirga sp.]|jgi:hypothetical protein